MEWLTTGKNQSCPHNGAPRQFLSTKAPRLQRISLAGNTTCVLLILMLTERSLSHLEHLSESVPRNKSQKWASLLSVGSSSHSEHERHLGNFSSLWKVALYELLGSFWNRLFQQHFLVLLFKVFYHQMVLYFCHFHFINMVYYTDFPPWTDYSFLRQLLLCHGL